MAKTGGTMSQKPKKIVSTREYLKAIGKRLMLITLSLAWFIVAFVDVEHDLLRVFPRNLFLKIAASSAMTACLCNLLIFLGAGWAGIRTLKKARQIDPVRPCTRANIAYVPAVDSLVRASSEPLQEQERVLLRASLQSQQTPSKELLRSVEEQKT